MHGMAYPFKVNRGKAKRRAYGTDLNEPGDQPEAYLTILIIFATSFFNHPNSAVARKTSLDLQASKKSTNLK